MSSQLSIDRVLAGLHGRIEHHKRQEAFHTAQEVFHQQEKVRHAAVGVTVSRSQPPSISRTTANARRTGMREGRFSSSS